MFSIHPSRGNVYSNCEIYQSNQQSVTSRLETFRYRDFSQFFESIGLGLENFGLEKSLGIGLENIWSQKKSRYQSQKKVSVTT